MNTRFWNFTWDTNVKQKKLPTIRKLVSFLNTFAEIAVFQEEEGTVKGKKHYQGHFTLVGPRISKRDVLIGFSRNFNNVEGLTLTPTSSSIASDAYCTKEEGRVDGPFYCGKSEKFDQSYSTMELSTWQKQIYDSLLSPEIEDLRGRNIISIHDARGKSGKSQFTKWLRVGQRQLTVRKLPVASVQQLNSAVYLITKTTQVDLFVIDVTRSLGKDQSFKDLFSALEDVINGYVTDVMFGKFHEAIFRPPTILLFTNYEFQEIHPFMSDDRWVPFLLGADKNLSHILHKGGVVESYVPFQSICYSLELQTKK